MGVASGCEQWRELLSAGLDGESTPDEQAAADAHLAGCADCRQWLDDAAAATRLARTSLVAGGVDVTGAVLPAVPRRRRVRLALVLRGLLVLLGLAQLTLAVAQMVTLTADGHVHAEAARGGAAPGHLWNESAAWNAAVGIAFLWAAVRRGRPAGLAAILSAFVGALLLLSVGDLIADRVEPERLATHAFMLAGYAIVLALSLPRLGLGRPPGPPVATVVAPPAATGTVDGDDAGLAPVIALPRRVRAPRRNERRNAA